MGSWLIQSNALDKSIRTVSKTLLFFRAYRIFQTLKGSKAER